MKPVDPLTLAVLSNNLRWITEEMNVYLAKAGFSTNIKVRKDCSCALYTPQGDMLAQGTFIPVHLGMMSKTLKELLKEHPPETLKEGDAIAHNDPFRMGSHLWDVMVFKPIFFEERIIGFAGSLAHHVDIGGSPLLFTVPTIYEEGIRIPAVKIMKEGKIQEDIIKILAANVRTAYELKGDLMAQTAANRRGEERMKGLAQKYGVDTLLSYFGALLDYAERGMREAIYNIPDGEAEFEDFIESDGIEDKLIPIRVKVTVKDSDIEIDFKGSGKPGAGGINSPWSLTHSAAYYAIKCIIAPDVPTNTGTYRPIHLVRPQEESIVDVKPPHAVGACTGTPAQRIIDAIIGAFSKLVPEKVCACDGHWPGICCIGVDSRQGRYFSYVETYACGRGAKNNEDGANAHQTHLTNTANAPVEIIELEHPLQVERYAIVQDSGGPGEFRGGMGLSREITLLDTMSITTKPMRPHTRPYGLFGGKGGSNDSSEIIRPDGTSISATCRDVEPGSRVIIRTSGGGGWGDPMKRDIEKIECDVQNGYVSLDSANEHYGCRIDPQTLKADLEATQDLRNSNRRI